MDAETLRTLSTKALGCFRNRPPSEIGGRLLGEFEPNEHGERSPSFLGAKLLPSEVPLFRTRDTGSQQLSRALRRSKSEGLSVWVIFAATLGPSGPSVPQEPHKTEINLRVLRMPGRQLELIWDRNVTQAQNAQKKQSDVSA